MSCDGLATAPEPTPSLEMHRIVAPWIEKYNTIHLHEASQVLSPYQFTAWYAQGFPRSIGKKYERDVNNLRQRVRSLSVCRHRRTLSALPFIHQVLKSNTLLVLSAPPCLESLGSTPAECPILARQAASTTE